MFCDDVRQSSEYSSISFGETVQNLKLNNTVSTIPENGEAYSLVPRKPVERHMNKAPVKIKSSSNEARHSIGSANANQAAASGCSSASKGAIRNPVVQPLDIAGSNSSTCLQKTKEPLLHPEDVASVIQGSKSTGSCVDKAPQSKMSSNSKPAQAIPKDVDQDAASGTNSTCKQTDLNTISEPVQNLCHIPEASAESAQHQPAVKDTASKKRKEPPPPSTEDLNPALWESLVRDGGIQKTTVPAMKLFLASVKLPVSGKKEVLIERLRKHFKL
jgi:hypothetical protein